MEEDEGIGAVRTTSVPPMSSLYENLQRVFFGRRKIQTSLKKEELTVGKIIELLPKILKEHEANSQEIDYLYRYYKGEQPILGKTKTVRPEINNVVLENHAYEIVEFKKSAEFGEPVQYVQKGESNLEEISKEISLLNKFMESEDKSTLDNELAEWQYIGGTAYRWCDKDNSSEEDDVPFEISVPDPRRTFVVYTNGIKEEQLLSGFYSLISEDVYTELGVPYTAKSRLITIYTDDKYYKFKENLNTNSFDVVPQILKLGDLEEFVEGYPLIIKGQRIIEYPLNQARMGIIEIVITQLNALNKIKSDDLDAIDQFVESLLVFINQEVDPVKFKQLIGMGAVQIKSESKDLPADVKLLTQELLHSQTKIVTDDLYEKMLTILGIPKNSSKSSGGDTGQARQIGEGWELSYQRAKQDDLMFKKSERKFLKLVLNICKSTVESEGIRNLKITDIDIKIPRNKADNLLTKAQALMNLLSSGVHPEVAFTVVGLFGDPHDVYVKSLNFQGEDFWKKVKEMVDNKLVSETKEENQTLGKDKNTSTNEGNS